MGLSRIVSKINGDFSRKSQKKIHPVYFAPLLKGFPLELGTGAQGQKLEWLGYWAEKEVWRYVHPSGYNAPTRQMNGQADGHRATAKTALIRIASRGKKSEVLYFRSISKYRRRLHQVECYKYVFCWFAFLSGNNTLNVPSAAAAGKIHVGLLVSYDCAS